jgi:probable F420-dependent oxidoreductase
MHLGALFPTCEIGADPIAVRDFVQAAEGLGYARLLFFDHVLATPHDGRFPPLTGPYTEQDPFHEAIVLMSFVAGVTTTVELMTGVLVLPQRQTAVVAKQAAELQALSNGRLTLGVGTGWNHVEYEALDVDYDQRGARLDEQVEVLRRLWREPIVDFTGRFHRIDRAGLCPLPPSPVPIWFGGMAPVALRRAAAIGDGYLTASHDHAVVERLLELRSAAGRTLSGFGLGEIVNHADAPARREPWEALGGTHLFVSTQAPGTRIRGDAPRAFDRPEDHIAALESVMRTTGP